MSHRDDCPTEWEARREGERAYERGYGSNPYRGDYGRESSCEEAERAWGRGYRHAEERREEEEAEARAAQRRDFERSAYEQAQEDEYWRQREQDEARYHEQVPQPDPPALEPPMSDERMPEGNTATERNLRRLAESLKGEDRQVALRGAHDLATLEQSLKEQAKDWNERYGRMQEVEERLSGDREILAELHLKESARAERAEQSLREAREPASTFTVEEVRYLWEYQTRHVMHPFTCPNRGDGKHFNNGIDLGGLIPTVRGWICQCCDYRQDWAHDFMLNGEAVKTHDTWADRVLAARSPEKEGTAEIRRTEYTPGGQPVSVVDGVKK